MASGTVDIALDVEIFSSGAALSRIIPVKTFTQQQILTGNRNTKYFVDVLDRFDSFVGRLEGLAAGGLDWIANAAVKGAGSMTIVDIGQDIDWLNVRFRPVMVIDGLDDCSWGIFLPSESPERWGSGRNWNVKMLDKTTVLNRHLISETYSLDAGTVVTTKVVELIILAGETNIAVTPSAETLSAPLSWDPGTSILSIVNDLLHTIGYISLFCDYSGQYRGEPNVLPAHRPIQFEFVDGPESIYLPEFEKDVDLEIPNEFIAIGQGDGTTEALISVATNNDVLSPYSIVNRGRTITAPVARGIEVTSQTVLDEYALRRLIELTSQTSMIDINFAPVPGLAVNNAVRLERVPAGIDARHVVSRLAISFDPTALASATLMEVVDL